MDTGLYCETSGLRLLINHSLPSLQETTLSLDTLVVPISIPGSCTQRLLYLTKQQQKITLTPEMQSTWERSRKHKAARGLGRGREVPEASAHLFLPGTCRAWTGSTITAPNPGTDYNTWQEGAKSLKRLPSVLCCFSELSFLPFPLMSAQFVSLATSPELHMPLLWPSYRNFSRPAPWMQYHCSSPSERTKGQDKLKSEMKIKPLPQPYNMGSSTATQQE